MQDLCSFVRIPCSNNSFVNPYLERLYLFLNHLQNKLGKQQEEDLAQGILDNIDMENLRYQLEATTNIVLQQGDELKPIPTEMRTEQPSRKWNTSPTL